MPLVRAREQARLAELHALRILDTEPEEAFDDLVRLAARIAGTPTALVSLLDEERQWFKARVGLEVPSTGRDIAMCDHVVRDETELLVPDARVDARFADNPLVTGPPHIVFYAGFPLVTPTGLVLGTLCVIGYEPHDLDEQQKQGLRTLARQVMSQMQLRRIGQEQAAEIASRRVVEDRLAREGEFLQAVLDSVEVGIVACDADGRLTLFNDAATSFHGLTADPSVAADDLPRRFDLYRADGRTPLPAEELPLLCALREGAVSGQEIVIAPAGLPTRLVRCDGRALHDSDGATTGAVVAMTDITAARQAEHTVREAHDALTRSNAALQRSEAQFRSAFENGPMAMLRLDESGVVVQANPATRRLLGLTSSAVVGHRLADLAASADRERLALALARAGGEDAVYVEVRMRLAHGGSLWCEVAVSAGGDGNVLVQVVDVEDRKRRETELERQVARDDLTGLANRSALHRRLAELLAPEATRPTCVLYLDLNRFKDVNDTAGHSVGDEVLVEVGQRLRRLVRPEDLVARLGGDEFVLARQDADGRVAERGDQLAQRVRAALAVPFCTSAGEHRLGASVGVVVAEPGEDLHDVLARADAAMYGDKRS